MPPPSPSPPVASPLSLTFSSSPSADPSRSSRSSPSSPFSPTPTETPPLSSVSSQITLCDLPASLTALRFETAPKGVAHLSSERTVEENGLPLVKSSSRCLSRVPSKIAPEHELGPPPDGGLVAWSCIASAFFLLVCVFGLVTSMGQLQSYYATHQLAAYPKATIAWISTLQSTLTFFASVFFGRIFDAHGAKILVRVGTTLSVASLVAVAFCEEYYQFLLAHALFGFSGSLLWTPAAAVSGHWFEAHRSTAIGIVGCGSGIGGIIYPIMLERLLKQFTFRDTILIVAAMNAVLMMPSWLFLRTRLPPRAPPPWSDVKKPWKESRYLCLALGSGLCMLNMFSPYFDAPVLATANHLPESVAKYSIAILQAGSFLGRATSGFLADRLGAWRVFVSMGLLTAIVLFSFWTAPVNAAATVAGMACYGYTSGAWITLVSAVTVAISAPHEAGMRVGMMWTVVSIPILAGPVVCGVLVEADGGRFTIAGIFCGVSYVVGTVISILPVLVRMVRSRKANDVNEVCE